MILPRFPCLPKARQKLTRDGHRLGLRIKLTWTSTSHAAVGFPFGIYWELTPHHRHTTFFVVFIENNFRSHGIHRVPAHLRMSPTTSTCSLPSGFSGSTFKSSTSHTVTFAFIFIHFSCILLLLFHLLSTAATSYIPSSNVSIISLFFPFSWSNGHAVSAPPQLNMRE